MSVSSRMLRKFKSDKEALVKDNADGSDLDESPYMPAPRTNLNINRYNLLNDETQSESEVKEDDDKEIDSSQRSLAGQEHRVSKRKRKKKKRKSLPASQKHSSEDLDEVERSVREVNAILGQSAPAPGNANTAAVAEKGVLVIDRKHLNPKNELKRMFGTKTIQASESGSKNRGRNCWLPNLWLVSYRNEWSYLSKSGPGLSMTLVEKKDGVQYFKYEHSPSYQAAEKQFLACVDSMDPDQLMLIANTYPFHVNTLIQLAEICKMSEEISIAAQFIERALYALETGFHPMFNLAKANSRLDYKYQENRALYIVIFNHIIYVGQRACYRTSLEFCKVLLSLDPVDDPLAIVLAIDFYAIRAGEYKWLLQLIEETDHCRFLTFLPNMRFSRALAFYHLGDSEKADENLQDALIMFPGVLIPLLEKCSIVPDSKTNGSPFFQDGYTSAIQISSLKTFTELYVQRSYHLWKDAQIMHWLERNTIAVLSRVEKKDPLIAEYAKKRAGRFVNALPRAVQRHVLLSDLKDVHITEHGTTLNFDPLPPLDSVNIYIRPARQNVYDHFNTVSLFFRTMMPFFNEEGHEGGAAEVNAAAAAAVALDQPPNEDEAAGGSNRASLHRSVSTLIDAMRNLITNLQPQNDSGNESTDGSGSEGS